MTQTADKKPFAGRVKEFLIINLGLILMSFGVFFFKIPYGFSTGGVSGIATILGGGLGLLSPSVLIAIINMVLLLIGFIFLGTSTGIKTVYGSVMFSLETWLLERICPAISYGHPLTDEPFLELVWAILLTAIGSSLLFHCGATTGGTDIVALILKKYTSLDTGKALLLTDFLIAASSVYFFGWKIGLFSLLGLFAKAFLVDSVIETINQCKCVMIISDGHANEIADYIMSNIGRGVTEIDAEGGYTHGPKKALITVCSRIQAYHLKQEINRIDPQAFVVITNTNEIVGRGFRRV